MRGVWPLWNLRTLERDDSLRVPQTLGAFSCGWKDVDRPMKVRFGACEGKGNASLAEYCLLWQKNGWQMLCRRGALIAFGAEGDAQTPDDGGLDRLFDRAIRRRENARVAAFVLAAVFMIAGYAFEGFTVVRLAAVPLAAALALSLSIGKLQKAK